MSETVLPHSSRDSVSVIVGGGGALGSASAVALAERGSSIVVTGPTQRTLDKTVRAVTAAGGEAMAVRGDASKEADVERVFNLCRDRFGPCDVFVHAAAVQGPTARLVDISLEQWESVMRINLGSVFLCARAALRQMVPNGKGSIILVSSSDALRGFPMTGPYAATKSALTGFGRALAAETRGTGVRVNVLSPGPMPEAAIFRTAISGIASQLGIQPEDVLRTVTGDAGALRNYDPREVARGVVFLATPDSSMMTGQSVVMDSLFTPV